MVGNLDGVGLTAGGRTPEKITTGAELLMDFIKLIDAGWMLVGIGVILFTYLLVVIDENF